MQTRNTHKYSYKEIGQMIKVHLDYLLAHKKQLVRIKLGEPYGIDKEEADEYFADTVGYTPDETRLSRTEYIKELDSTLANRIQMFKQLKIITSKDESEKSILLLHFMLEYCLENSKFLVSATNRKAKLKQNYVSSAFSEKEQLSFLLKKTKKILPTSYTQISKGIRISSESGRTLTPYGEVYSVNMVDIISHQGVFISDYSHVIDALKKMEIQSLNKIAEIVAGAINHYSILLVRGSEEFQALPNPSLENPLIAISNAHFELNEKLDAILKLKLTLDELKVIYEDEKEIKRQHDDTYKMLHSEILKLSNKINRTHCKIGKLKKNQGLDEIKEKKLFFIQLKIEITQLISTFENKLENYKNINDLDTDKFSSRDKLFILLNTIKDKLKLADKQIQSINKMSKSIKSNMDNENNSDFNTATNIQPTDREKYIHEQIEKNNKYRENVERIQREKLERSATSLGILTSPSLSISSSSPSPSPSVSKPFTTFNSPHTESPAMLRRLKNLSERHLNLLEQILNREQGAKIKYREVASLITNQLGGNISEIGNGSSHKRIRIEKLYFEVNSKSANTSERDETAPSPSLATGGFYKPHGKAKNSGFMSRFNLGLVADAFNGAGITLEAIEEIRNQKFKL